VKYGFPMSCARAKDPSIDTITTVLNLKGLSIRLLTPLVLRFLKMVMDVDQNYYPECLGKTFIVNVPGLFSNPTLFLLILCFFLLSSFPHFFFCVFCFVVAL